MKLKETEQMVDEQKTYMRQYENINKIVMLENEAAYKKVNDERVKVDKLLKTSFDPSVARKKREAEKLLEDLQKHRY